MFPPTSVTLGDMYIVACEKQHICLFIGNLFRRDFADFIVILLPPGAVIMFIVCDVMTRVAPEPYS